MGRARQRLPLLNPRQWAWLIVSAAIGGLLLTWHLALVLTAGVPVAGIGVTLRGIITADPLSLGAKYPADGTAVLAWAVLVAAGVAGVLLVRRWWTGRHRDGPLGFASAQAAQMSAGERRARDKARWSRRGSVARGFDPDTAPLNEVGFLLGHERAAGEPVVLTLEDQTGIIAPTGAGKTLHLIVGACLDAPGPLVATSTRPEILDAIVEARTALGRVWVFDPLNAAYWPEPMVWDPTAGAAEPAVATARGLAFAGGLQVDNDKDGAFFQARPSIAAARSGRAMMIPAWAWKNAPSLSLSTCNPPANANPRAVATAGPRRRRWGPTPSVPASRRRSAGRTPRPGRGRCGPPRWRPGSPGASTSPPTGRGRPGRHRRSGAATSPHPSGR